MYSQGVLYWITGLSGAGKTTIGNTLYYNLKKKKDNVILLDGDILKNAIEDEPGYTEQDRRKRALKYAKVCKILVDQGMIVICCTIAMYDEVRKWNRDNNKGYIEIFLDVPMEVLVRRNQKNMYSKYQEGIFKNLMGVDIRGEFPKNPDILLKNDGSISVKECVNRIQSFQIPYSKKFNRDTDYWNQYYSSGNDIVNPSLFARKISKVIRKPCDMLELGCGNGRDSLYFNNLGVNVVAIDASDIIINKLITNYNRDGLCFICDDFVCSSAIFARQYDYCYSRFSLHAINEEQEKTVIKNVYNGLKKNGQFFIEVRSINDNLFGNGTQVERNSYVFNGHYRRFIVKSELEQNLINTGFYITYSEEQRGFAPFNGDNPPIIRIVASK